jgi:hypothetical protein
MSEKNYRVFVFLRKDGTRSYTVIDKYDRIVIITTQKAIVNTYLI